MKKALILTYEKFQDHEVIYPFYRLTEDNFQVEIMSNKTGRFYGILGTYMEGTHLVEDLNRSEARNEFMQYDMLVIPGGVKALEKLRQEQVALDFISEWNAAGKVIACICHGAQLLISARVTKGRDISGYYSIKDDIINSGANYVDEPVVISDNIITSPHYKYMGPWLKTAIDMVLK
jgi:protease I